MCRLGDRFGGDEHLLERVAQHELLLFAARTVSLTQHFVDVQPDLAGLARSFDYVPRGALVLPIVAGDQDPIERPFTHFWAYGVIRRGWFSPYLADQPGVTPMRIIYDSYTSDGFWDQVYEEAPEWKQVQNDYEYVWAYAVPRFSAALSGIGDKIYSYDALEVYRIRKLPENSARTGSPEKGVKEMLLSRPGAGISGSRRVKFANRNGEQ